MNISDQSRSQNVCKPKKRDISGIFKTVMNKAKSHYIFMGLIVLIVGCNSTQVTSSWKAKDATLHTYNKLLVMGIMSDTNRSLKQDMEKDLVADLKSQGINAVSALDEYGPNAFRGVDKKQVDDQLKAKGYDGIVTITLLNKSKERYYSPGYMDYTPFAYNYNYFWGYYSNMYDRVYEPGYYETATNYLWESNLYDLAKGKLVYSVQSKSFDPASAMQVGKGYGRSTVRDLVKNGLIVKAKG